MTRAAPRPPAPIATPAARWRERQLEALGWKAGTSIGTPREAEQFLLRYGVVLRYGAVPSVPIASLRRACGSAVKGLDDSIRLTNALLASATGVEVNVVADRLTIVHRSHVAALYRLVRQDRLPDDRHGLGAAARAALFFIESKEHASVGDIRRHLGVRTPKRPDPADHAVAELQQAMLVDRGPFAASATGIPYLSREGYPYRLFHVVHADLVRAARSLTRESAADAWLGAYIDGAAVAVSRSMATLFRRFLSPTEIAATIERLAAAGRLRVVPVGRSSVIEATAVRRRR
jgi:hypothetical protein